MTHKCLSGQGQPFPCVEKSFTMMTFNPARHHRRSIRLKGYDYAQVGAYFVTICTKNRECLFGEIINGIVHLNAFGAVAQTCWDDLPHHYPHAQLDASVIMPNHIHGIMVLDDPAVGAGFKPAPTSDKRHGLSEIVRAFKTFSSRRINQLRQMPGAPFWQRGYYEHIIRDENSLHNIRRYIQDNPSMWTYDAENPNRIKRIPEQVGRFLALYCRDKAHGRPK